MAKRALGQDSRVGHVLGHYRIDEKIGEGGMSVVYRAHDKRLDRDVAIKILAQGSLTDETARERFRKEAHALSKLNHTNIATVHDFDAEGDIDFLVEELIEGLSLEEMLMPGPLPEKEIVNLGSQLAEGLAAAHEHGIVHRDLKPGNIRVTPEGHVKILDFGLAKGLHTPALMSNDTGTVSETQIVAGTLPYMSPEQLRNEKLDGRTDIWALGCVLYEMSAGRRPFPGGGTGLIEEILHESQVSPSLLNHKLSPGLEAIIQKCLEKDPADRYASAREIVVDLHRLNTASPGVHHKHWIRKHQWIGLSLVAALLLAVAVMLTFFGKQQVRPLTEKDTVILGDFANSTGDPVFTDSLRQGLLVQLSQSPFLNILSVDQVRTTLRQMGHDAHDPLNDDLAREVCQRNRSKAFITGSIASLGKQYVLSLKAVSCETGDVLVQEQTQVPRKEEVLESLGRQASLLRHKLGESLGSVRKFNALEEQATTPSLEALQAYDLGAREMDKSNQDAIPYFKRAIELDPNFALAYARLASIYSNLEQAGTGEEYIRKAYSLRERVTDRERLRIEAAYYVFATGQLEKAVQVYEVYKSTYPQASLPYNNLGVIYLWLGQYVKSSAEFREVLRRNPDANAPVAYANLVECYLALGQLEQAEHLLAEAEAKRLPAGSLAESHYLLGFLRRDSQAMDLAAKSASDPGMERQLLGDQSETEAYYGHLKKSRELRQRTVDSAKRNELFETAAAYLAAAAVHESDFGNFSEAQRLAKESLALTRTRNVMAVAATAYAQSGNLRQAQALAEELGRDYPDHTLLHLAWLPAIGATIEIKQNNPSRAIETLQKATSVELGKPIFNVNNGLIFRPEYTRGQAYLLLQSGNEAAAEFKKILDHPGVSVNDPLGALAHLGMARALVLQHETDKARAEYEQFLNLWKDADPDIPVLQQARAEYGKLK